jgi:hypothetical protein
MRLGPHATAVKKLYIYGGLNAGEPLTLRPHAGMGGFSWGVAGFLLGSGTAAITEDDKQRVADEIQTTFATSCENTCSTFLPVPVPSGHAVPPRVINASIP